MFTRRMIPTFWEAAKGAVRMPSQWGSSTYLLAEKDGAEGRMTVAIYAIELKASGSRPLMPHVAVTVVQGKPMETGKIALVADPELYDGVFPHFFFPLELVLADVIIAIPIELPLANDNQQTFISLCPYQESCHWHELVAAEAVGEQVLDAARIPICPELANAPVEH